MKTPPKESIFHPLSSDYVILDGITHEDIFTFQSIADVVSLFKELGINPAKIKHLSIPNNSIEEIDESITLFTSLRELNLVNNKIQKHCGRAFLNFLEDRMHCIEPDVEFKSCQIPNRYVSFLLLLDGNEKYFKDNQDFTIWIGACGGTNHSSYWKFEPRFFSFAHKKKFGNQKFTKFLTDLNLKEFEYYEPYAISTRNVTCEQIIKNSKEKGYALIYETKNHIPTVDEFRWTRQRTQKFNEILGKLKNERKAK
jgi:hypothetical protein